MSDPFVHLHVASGYSLQYGASHPHVLVERAAEQEMDALALTDRDGTYGAVRFAKAAMAAGIRPILGVDLAVLGRDSVPDDGAARARPSAAHPGPGRRLPRPPGCPGSPSWPAAGSGWAAVCRLVSATHPAGERGTPVCTPDAGGRARRRARRPGAARARPPSWAGRPRCAATTSGRAVLRRWLDLVGPEQLAVEVVSHRLPGSGPGSSPHAARMAGLARPAAGAGSRSCSPTRSASPTGSTPPRPTCSTPPAGWCRWTCATSTAATPRAS